MRPTTGVLPHTSHCFATSIPLSAPSSGAVTSNYHRCWQLGTGPIAGPNRIGRVGRLSLTPRGPRGSRGLGRRIERAWVEDGRCNNDNGLDEWNTVARFVVISETRRPGIHIA